MSLVNDFVLLVLIYNFFFFFYVVDWNPAHWGILLHTRLVHSVLQNDHLPIPHLFIQSQMAKGTALSQWLRVKTYIPTFMFFVFFLLKTYEVLYQSISWNVIFYWWLLSFKRSTLRCHQSDVNCVNVNDNLCVYYIYC